ncbi:DUF3857 domain-containing protein [Sphingomonas alpina]|uniref:DUF3857 domain-containing protein n=1 Tax=Sphingomonas alpina TaxID=653931 RepID=A0A7H0LEF5_9SPHN|nr:DUF3857 domain-containing protein [Sphingomonas alpina]QNQ08058.1 DUF3857 domain-containing protein [Sphingomonas alpina]
MLRPIFFTALIAAASAAQASDKPIYAPAPDWIKPAPAIDTASIKDESPVFLLLDGQQLLKDGQITSYVETAARVASTQMLDQIGSIKLPWQPDKGDLIIHKLEIIRGSEHVDLIAAGQRFSVLQREEQLEQRMLNGVLTATLAVEGLRVGDVLHMSISITQKDPTLKGNLQTISLLPTDPFRIQFGRTRLIWPKDAPMHWRLNVAGLQPEVTTIGGYRELSLALPLAKQPEMPSDSPTRFRRLPMLEATSFGDWASISSIMAPLYATDGLIAPGSPLAGEVAKIMAADSDPLKRTALALALVQDKIRYLFKGMDGGNYVPQTPTQTWSLRYGDCKAKTLLLLAMLHQMGIEAEPVLASSQLGDALPDRLPSPGAFDHVFVRATVAGETLWLDGTGAGTQFADIRDTPAFRNVLPLRTAGAALMPLPMRPSARPEMAAEVELDESAGANFPAPFKAAMTMRGPLAQLMKAGAAQASKDQLTEMAKKMSENLVTSPTIITRRLSFDDAAGTATLHASGVAYPDWTRENERYRIAIDSGVSDLSFAPDRTRTAWRDIPVSTGDAQHTAIRTRIILPDGGKGYTLEGNMTLSDTLAGTKVDRTATLANGVITTDAKVIESGGEIAAADIGAVRQRLAQAKQHLLRVVAPADLPPAWQIVEAGKRAKKFDAILALYKQAISDGPGKAEPYTNRAWFFEKIYEPRQAIDDVTRAIAIEPSVDSYLWRARLLSGLGDRDKALADLTTARKIDPASSSAVTQLATLYADRGNKDQALSLLDERIGEGGKDKADFMATKAVILGEAGDKEAAIETIDAAIATSPGNPGLLNSRCWLKGTLDTMLDTALKDCTKSIELSDSPQEPLDSRAMVYFRLNRLDDALADLNAALDLEPDRPESIYMRGMVRKRMGDAKASDVDLAAARMISPIIDQTYAKYGIKP